MAKYHSLNAICPYQMHPISLNRFCGWNLQNKLAFVHLFGIWVLKRSPHSQADCWSEEYNNISHQKALLVTEVSYTDTFDWDFPYKGVGWYFEPLTGFFWFFGQSAVSVCTLGNLTHTDTCTLTRWWDTWKKVLAGNLYFRPKIWGFGVKQLLSMRLPKCVPWFRQHNGLSHQASISHVEEV